MHTCTKSSGPLVRYGNFTLKLWNIAILIRVIVVNVAAKFLQRTYSILLIPYNKRHPIKFFNFPIIYCVLEIPSTIVWLSLWKNSQPDYFLPFIHNDLLYALPRQYIIFKKSRKLFTVLQGYPPYRNDGSKIGYSVNAFSMPLEYTLHPVCCCKYWFPPIWSALECVFKTPDKFQPFSSKILRTFLHAFPTTWFSLPFCVFLLSPLIFPQTAQCTQIVSLFIWVTFS